MYIEKRSPDRARFRLLRACFCANPCAATIQTADSKLSPDLPPELHTRIYEQFVSPRCPHAAVSSRPPNNILPPAGGGGPVKGPSLQDATARGGRRLFAARPVMEQPLTGLHHLLYPHARMRGARIQAGEPEEAEDSNLTASARISRHACDGRGHVHGSQKIFCPGPLW